MGVELVQGRRHHVEILDRRALVGGAPQHLDLALGRGVDLDHVAVDPAPAVDRAEPVRHVGQPGIGDLEADAGRQPRDAAQLVERPVRDLDAAVHDDDASGALLQLGQGVRGQQHRRAAPAQLLDDLVEAAGAGPGRGRWSARRAAARAARPSSAWARPSRWRMPLE